MKKEQSVIHRRRIEKLLRRLLLEIGENPDREGLIETPTRIVEMYEELFSGSKTPQATLRSSIFSLARSFEEGGKHMN